MKIYGIRISFRFIALCLLLWAVPAIATNYYVTTTGNDGNGCTNHGGDACLTLDRVAPLAGPGDTIYVDGDFHTHGVRLGAGDCPSCQNGTNFSGGVIKWLPYPGTEGTTTVGFVEAARAYYEFTLSIYGPTIGNAAGYLVTSPHVKIHDADINQSGADGIFAASFAVATTTDWYFYNLTIHDVGKATHWGDPGVVETHCLYIDGGDYNYIEGNDLSDCGNAGVISYGIQYSSYTDWRPSHNIFRRNKVHDSGSGVFVGTSGHDNEVSQNKFYRLTGTGIIIGVGSDNKALSNTIYGSGGFGIQVAGSQSAVVENNIIFGSGSNDVYIWPGSVSTSVLKNLTGNGVQDFGTSTSAPDNAITTELALKFNNAGADDFTLQSGSSAIGFGNNLYSYFTTDYTASTARPSSGPFDNGAYQQNTSPLLASCTPNSGAQGVSNLDVACVGSLTNFVNMTSVGSVSGIGITIVSTTVSDATHATVRLSISGGATLSARNITITTGGEVVTLTNGFTVTSAPSPTISVVSPNTAAQLTSDRTVTLTGTNTHWDGSCLLSFSDAGGINTLSVTNNSATSETLHLQIAGDAALTTRDLIMTCGSEVSTAVDGFSITYTQQPRFGPFSWKN